MSSFSSSVFLSVCSPQPEPLTWSCWTNDSRMPTNQHSSNQSETGRMERFSKTSYVASCHNCLLCFKRAMFMSLHTMSKPGRPAWAQAVMASSTADAPPPEFWFSAKWDPLAMRSSRPTNPAALVELGCRCQATACRFPERMLHGCPLGVLRARSGASMAPESLTAVWRRIVSVAEPCSCTSGQSLVHLPRQHQRG